jgi:hypothetical protein
MLMIVNANKTWITLGVIILSSFTFATAKPTLTRFPGELSEISSPNERYVLYNIDNDKSPPYHALYLKDLRNNTNENLFSYSRYVDVLWSPQGTGLIVNDHGGSDYSNSMIYLLNGVKGSIDLKAVLHQKMGENKSIFRNHHVYIEIVEWLDENRVKVNISGYGDIDPNGFELWYEYTIGNGFRRIKNE